MKEENNSWCPVPWVSINVRNNGDYRVCCHANISESRGVLKSDSGDVLNAAKTPLETARNSSALKSIRLAMLRGERHPICVRCNREDDAGIKSRRIYERSFWEDSFKLEDARSATNPDGSIRKEAAPVGQLDLRFGNLCNLKCRMCGPVDSSRWMKEYFETESSVVHDGQNSVRLESIDGAVKIAGDNPYDWHGSEDFWKDLENHTKGLKKIYTVGGEPLLINRHYEMLEQIIRSGRAQEVIIEYNSNVTVISDRALSIWRHFKEVRIGASVDGYGKINDYIRHPSRWANIEKNLELLDQADAPLKAWIATTVQAYNIYYLPEFLRWKMEKKFSRINSGSNSPFLTLHPLHNPPYLSICVLPPSVKKMVADKFHDFFRNWFLPYLHSSDLKPEKRASLEKNMTLLLEGYLGMMNKNNLSEQLPEFWRSTKKMDAYRGESFEEVMPEIAFPIRDFLRGTGGVPA